MNKIGYYEFKYKATKVLLYAVIKEQKEEKKAQA